MYFLERLGYCWSYSPSSNKFAITSAINDCKTHLVYTLNQAEWKTGHDQWKYSYKYLIKIVKESVANCNDELYQGEYSSDGNDILFGSNSIDAKDFVDCFLYRYAEAGDLISAFEELEKNNDELNTLIPETE